MSSSVDSADNLENATLDSVLQDIDCWRANKHQYPNRAIPDTLWLKMFKLAQTHSESRLKKIFGLNNDQYKIKYHQLIKSAADNNSQTSNNKKNQSTQSGFCEVNATSNPSAPPSSKPALTTPDNLAQLKSNDNDPMSYLDLSTIIVECIHPNGHRLRIHTTTKKLPEVMKAFFECSESAL